MPKFDLDKLPEKISVKIERTQEGNFIAELPELENVFTQAENLEVLNYGINDLIMAYFDVPKNVQKFIWYEKPDKRSEADKINVALEFQMWVPRNLQKKWQ
ncbi:MAG: hypothetical protein Q8Q65_02195 [bacterium]|nr:hypothetical protein [bacterium]